MARIKFGKKYIHSNKTCKVLQLFQFRVRGKIIDGSAFVLYSDGSKSWVHSSELK